MSLNATIFGQYASHYAASRPQYRSDMWRWIAAQCEAHEHAWDAGCGNGQASVALAEHFRQVTATDISEAQIKAAPSHPRVKYQVAASESVGFAPQSLDLVCVAQALHWFDLKKFWPAVKSALKPRGLFVTVSYSGMTISEEIDAATKKWFAPMEPYWAAGNRSVMQGYADITFPFEMMEVPAFPLQCEWTLSQVMAYMQSWSAVVRYQKETGHDLMPDYKAQIEPLWGDVNKPKTIHMPMTIKLGRNC